MVIDEKVPAQWLEYAAGRIPAELQKDLINEHQTKYGQLFGKKFLLKDAKVIGGMIVANGLKDIANADSELHARNHSVITRDRNYFSISTNKFTSAPNNTFLLERGYIQALYAARANEITEG